MKEKDISASQSIQFVCFSIGGEEYGIDILGVQEIIKIPKVTPLPKAADYIRGVMDLRGRVIPVVDLGRRFGIGAAETPVSPKAIVVDIKGKRIALLIDSISQVIRMKSEDIEPPPPVVRGIAGRYISGIGKINQDFIVVLDIDRIFSSSELDAMS